jgi:hypothetical protein
MATQTGTFTLKGNDLGNLPSYSNQLIFASDNSYAGAGTGTLGTSFTDCLDGYAAYIAGNGGTMTYTLDGPGVWDGGADTLVTITISNFDSEGGELLHYSLLFITEEFTYPVVWRTAEPAVPTLCNTCQFIQLTECGDDDFRLDLGLPDGSYTAFYTDNTSGVIWEQGTNSNDSLGGLQVYQWFATAGMFNQYSFYTLTLRDSNGDPVSWVVNDVEYTCATLTFKVTVNVTD